MKLLLLDEDRNPYEVSSEEWAEACTVLARADVWPWRVGIDDHDDWGVSTVFLGYDAAGGCFETMIVHRKGDDLDEDADFVRYETWDQALAGHAAAVDELRAKRAE